MCAGRPGAAASSVSERATHRAPLRFRSSPSAADAVTDSRRRRAHVAAPQARSRRRAAGALTSPRRRRAHRIHRRWPTVTDSRRRHAHRFARRRRRPRPPSCTKRPCPRSAETLGCTERLHGSFCKSGCGWAALSRSLRNSGIVSRVLALHGSLALLPRAAGRLLAPRRRDGACRDIAGRWRRRRSRCQQRYEPAGRQRRRRRQH